MEVVTELQTSLPSEKILMLGKTEGKRRKRQQRIRWLDSNTDSVDVNLNKLQEIMKDGCLAFPSPCVGLQRVRHNLVTQQQQHPLGNVTPSSRETGPLCLSILSWGAASRWKKMLACRRQRPGPSTQTFKHGKSVMSDSLRPHGL